jgi:hypothetical protein
MNYLTHYIKLIRKAEKRGWTKLSVEHYVEEHHVFPQKIFGKNNRVVCLTAREHYIAHAMLLFATRKRYGVKHNKTIKMAFALSMMSSSKKKHIPNSKVYDSCREAISISMKEKLTGTRWWTDGTFEVQSVNPPSKNWKLGRAPGMGFDSKNNPSKTPEFRAKRAERNRDPELIEKIKKAKKEKGPYSPRTSLTDEQVLEIYADTRTPREIAEDFPCSIKSVRKIKNGTTFTWITNHENQR